MSRARKVDRNQAEIVQLFRDLGASVAITSSAGDGFPDIVVQFRNPARRNYNIETVLVEIKDGELSPSRRKLTPDQETFHSKFYCEIVKDRADVFRVMGMSDPDGAEAT